MGISIPYFYEETIRRTRLLPSASIWVLCEIATALNQQLHRTRRGSPWRHQHVARVIQQNSRFLGALSE
jgi:hypothetical protein